MKFLVSENQFQQVISRIGQEMEIYLLNEGINEDSALSILLKHKIENPEEILDFLKKQDLSKNNKMLPAMALFYVNTSNNSEFGQIIKTFKSLFSLKSKEGKTIQAPDVTVNKGNKVGILGREFDANEFEKFKNFIEHYFYVESDEEKEKIEKLYNVDANKVFENEKFIIWEAASDKICIQIFGRDNENRMFIERGYCLGWGTLTQPATHYRGHRVRPGDWGMTLYAVLDKEKYQKYKETGEDHSSLLNIVGIRPASDEDNFKYKSAFIYHDKGFFVWDKENVGIGNSVREYGGGGSNSVEQYINYLEGNGVNIDSVFKLKEYVDYSDDAVKSMVNYQGNERYDERFFALTPKQKAMFISEINILTPKQVEFYQNEMPINYLKGFLQSLNKLGNFSEGAFRSLNSNLRKTYINTKLIQLFSNRMDFFDKDKFLSYLINDDLVNYTVQKIQNSFNDTKNPNQNKEISKQILGLLSPERFFESLKGEKIVTINTENFIMPNLPENLNEYLSECTELTIENLSKIEKIPDSIGNISGLEQLFIVRCVNLETLPNSIGQLTNLTYLSLNDNSNLKNIPDISNLTNLEVVTLENCSSLEELPKGVENIGFLLNIIGVPLKSLPPLETFKEDLFINSDETTDTNLSKEEIEYLDKHRRGER